MSAKKPPKVEALVVNAIRRLQDLQGSTSREISSYISSEYDVPGPEIKRQVQLALRRGVSYGILQRSKGGYYSCNRNFNGEIMDDDELVERRGRRGCKKRRMKRKCKSRRKRMRRGCKKRRKRRSRKCKSRRRKRKCGKNRGEVEMDEMKKRKRSRSYSGSRSGSQSEGSTARESSEGGGNVEDSPPNQQLNPSPENCSD